VRVEYANPRAADCKEPAIRTPVYRPEDVPITGVLRMGPLCHTHAYQQESGGDMEKAVRTTAHLTGGLTLCGPARKGTAAGVSFLPAFFTKVCGDPGILFRTGLILLIQPAVNGPPQRGRLIEGIAPVHIGPGLDEHPNGLQRA
jgi:hypothetical protein